jgi:3-phytase
MSFMNVSRYQFSFGSVRSCGATILLNGIFFALLYSQGLAGTETGVIRPVVSLMAASARDQDDLCVWSHPSDLSKSRVIVSDKSANRILVYDLKGTLLQELDADKPGNIDIRHNVMIGNRKRTLVAVTIRTGGHRLQVYEVDSATGSLSRVDSGISTVPNYGGCLYHSRRTGKIYFFTTSEESVIGQYELRANDEGKISGTLVREWSIGKCEGAVADDSAGIVYIGEEARGVWKVGAEPDDPTSGKLVVAVGQHGIAGDIEGISIFPTSDEQGYLIVSDQGESRFHVLERQGGNSYLTSFSVEGARETDGIDAVSGNFGGQFSEGIFGCHTDGDRCAMLLTSWKSIGDVIQAARQAQSADSSAN